MPLQNRVTPFGDIVALAGRGLVIGNRGVLHDETRHIVRHSQVRRWIACRLEFRGRRRKIMRPRSWTELFFLDEATALAAGHRPCAECRYSDYRRFRELWIACFGEPVGADIMDRKLHAERIARRSKVTYRANVRALPDGTYVAFEGAAWLVNGDKLLAWSDEGYTRRLARPARGDVEVLTPLSIVAILDAGYRPNIHPSALSPSFNI
jgi:hypothetical protein